ncbi:MAG: hypothetical protein RLO51_21240 [Thalassobaculum sp.]|uniref:hypothetical protein n=1 Tax=Thalassobaculum sp. TaxID=2022740 RepID=UPI0032EEFD58
MADRSGQETGTGRSRDRRLDAVMVLLFCLMIAGGLAVFPVSVAANKLSGLWITLCASFGIG